MTGQMHITLEKVAEIRALLGDGDPELLHDTLEGETDLYEIIDYLLAKLGDEEAMQEAIAARINALEVRGLAAGSRITRYRAALAECLHASGEKSLRRPEATITAGVRKPAIVHIDESLLPEQFFKTERKPSRSAINGAIANGQVVAGVTLDNGGPTLTIRRK